MNRFLASKFNQDVLWNVASLGFLALGGVIINAIILRIRGDVALGIFNQVYAVYIVLSQIGVGGLQHSVLKHISHHQDDLDRCADITTSALLLVAAITVPLGGLGLLLAGPLGDLMDSPGVADGLRLAIPGLLFFAMNKVLINTLNGLQRMRAYAVFRSLRFILIPAAVIGIVWADLSDASLALSLTIAELLLFVVLIVFVYTRLIPLKRITAARERFEEHISFGVRGVLSGILTELNTRVDVLMLGYFTTDANVGIYSFAAMLAEGVSQLPLAIRWNIDPIIGRHFAQGETHLISDTARHIRHTFYPVMGALGAAAVLAYPVFLWLWLPDDNITTSWAIFSIIMIGVIVNAGYRPFLGILMQGGRPGAHTVFITSLVLGDALLNLIFIPLLGIYGAAIVTMITYTGEAVGLMLFSRRLFQIRL
ncbi:MAG: oligosaccharide flippase family protein [Anaerolineae bacterium]|nr:oligosaccharide flippase family protein [Anaerolineae bacterium]